MGYGRNSQREVRSFNSDSDSMNGLWDGIVVDDKDPLKLGRVKVRIFDLHDENTPEADLPWATGNFPSAFINVKETDKSGGFFHIPPIDALVNIMFRRGDPEAPVWIGGWFPADPCITGREEYGGGVRRTALYNGNKQPSCPTWRSLRGHCIEFDDEESVVRITSADGHMITLSDVAGNEQDDGIKLEDKKGNYVWLHTGSNKLEIRWNGDVEESYTGYKTSKIGGNWLVDVGGNFDVNVGGNTNLKGAGPQNFDSPTINLNCGLAVPESPNDLPQGESSVGDTIGSVLARLGNTIRKIVIG
jgi:hypothetical protein